MRWPWHRKKKGNGAVEATQARSDAERRLRATQQDWPKVREVTDSIRSFDRIDHIAEMMDAALRRSP